MGPHQSYLSSHGWVVAGANPISYYWGGSGGVRQEARMLAQHATAYIGEDLIGRTNGTDQPDQETSRAKHQGQEHPELTDWHKDKQPEH